MPAFLEIVDGPAKGKKVELKPGQTVTIGRSKAMVPIPEDEFMSSLHFYVGLSAGTMRLQNLSQSNGTLVNGQPADAVVLKSGDQIRAGSSTFSVFAPQPNPHPAQMRIGGWGFEHIPEGWQRMEGTGLRLAEPKEKFIATMSAVEEPLPQGKSLDEYVEAQMALVRQQIAGAEIKGPASAQIRGAEKALALSVRSSRNGVNVVQRQVYASCAGIAGVFTVTLSAEQDGRLRNDASRVVQGLSFFHG
jgi:hypothetical protein